MRSDESIKALSIADIEAIKSEISYIENNFAIGDHISIITNKLSEIFRVDSVVFAICRSGYMELDIDLHPYSFSENDLIFLLPGRMVKIKQISQDFKGLYILASKQFAEEIVPNISKLYFLLYMQNNHRIQLSKEEVLMYEDYLKFFIHKGKMKENSYKKQIVKHLVMAMLYDSYNILDSRNVTLEPLDRKEELTTRFLMSVSQNYRQHKTIAYYANLLCVTPKYLSIVVKKTTDKSASAWIDQYVMMEAKSLLSTTSLSIKEIAVILGFPNQSFFGKYFRRMTKLSPQNYRKSLP